MARQVRRGEAQHGPSALHAACAGDKDLYIHAMHEAGYLMPAGASSAPRLCPLCGWDSER